MITNKGLERASRQLHMSPLIAADMNPITDGDGDDDVIVEEQNQHCHQRPRPHAGAYMAPEVDNTGTCERPVEMSQAKEDVRVFGTVESPSTNYDGQKFGDYPLSPKPATASPRIRRVKSQKNRLED